MLNNRGELIGTEAAHVERRGRLAEFATLLEIEND
jgi:hypothetical protein